MEYRSNIEQLVQSIPELYRGRFIILLLKL